MKQAAFQQAISVVIPMYNEADNVAPLLHEVAAVLPRFATAEIVVVDDCSRDQTRENLLQLMPSMPQLRVISHRHNYGQSAGVVSGVRAARHEWIATLDGDGQNDPADIPQLFAELNKHLNATESLLLIGNRKQRNDNWPIKCGRVYCKTSVRILVVV
jgi:dolichol-phosphate mannosyltransferase